MITLQKVMATSDGKFVRLCQVGAKVAVEEALAGGQAVNSINTFFLLQISVPAKNLGFALISCYILHLIFVNIIFLILALSLLLISQAVGKLSRWRWKYRTDVGYLLQEAAPC